MNPSFWVRNQLLGKGLVPVAKHTLSKSDTGTASSFLKQESKLVPILYTYCGFRLDIAFLSLNGEMADLLWLRT